MSFLWSLLVGLVVGFCVGRFMMYLNRKVSNMVDISGLYFLDMDHRDHKFTKL